ncbi:rhomboid family intramembrane serine protease [Desulfosarcina ovata subsp. sediminis]|uniref:Rhomboid family intramembrane serine protease n=2 Tax=Desulfosarcina ovata TaxID=83564 RepID=A0A5K8A0X1_9BACT|nr:rhomboid family intramembrane serine protease [Desulfosarcina ovata subsp. sediminis]
MEMVTKEPSNGNVSRKRALLCPNCRRLVSADEPQCPYCGLPTPGARWKHAILTRGLNSEKRLIQTIITANVLMYLISLIMTRGGLRLSANPMFFLSPDSRGLLLLGATGTIPIDRLHHWWSLISASYLHGGILHIVFNMLALRQISPLIIHEYGTHRMFVIYTLSGVGGFLLSYLAGVGSTIGASAAVCGLIGSAIYYGKRRGGNYGQAIYRQVGGWALGIALFGVIVPGINNWAHGGGMATGILLSFAMGYNERQPVTFSHHLLAGVCMAATGGTLLWAIFTALFYRL